MDDRHVSRGTRATNYIAFTCAVLGGLVGVYLAAFHLATDPAADVHAYYGAGTRLNVGQPLYEQSASTSSSQYYFYPPLLAILFRPLALLPFQVAAALWMSLLVLALAANIRLLGIRNRWTWLALGWLAPAVAWSVTIGQAHVLTTLLMTLGTPFALALAGHIKIFPALAAIYWLGRRDWRQLGRFLAWAAALTVISFVLEPSATMEFLGFPSLRLVGEVNNLSLYAISPVLWALSVATLAVAALVLARTRYGWLMAVVLTVLVSPRLFLYQFSALLAAFRRPRARTTP